MSTITVGATTLTEFDDSSNARVWAAPGHTVSKQKLVTQRRRLPSNGSVGKGTLRISFGCEDSNGAILAQKAVIEVNCLSPEGAIAADIDAVIDLFQEFVADADFDQLMKTQFYYS